MTFLYILSASFVISMISLLGAALLVSKYSPLEKWLPYMVNFAAGVMLTVAFLDLLPEAMESAGNDSFFFLVFLGVIVFFFLERFVLWFHHHDEKEGSAHGATPSAVLIIVGDSLHNFIDGATIAAAFLANPALGIFTTLAIAAHEIPQEIADLSVLVHGGLSKPRALLFNFLSALAAMVGAVLGYLFLERVAGALPVLLSFAAGMFIYIACSDLIPGLHQEFKKEKSWKHSVPFVAGIILLIILIRLLEA